MPLDDLVSVIEAIKQRIREHGDTLRQNETRTRMALIDPLLTALGWDVADPGLVTPEYDVSGRRRTMLCAVAGTYPLQQSRPRSWESRWTLTGCKCSITPTLRAYAMPV